MKVAYHSPMPPSHSGVADYSALLLPALRERLEVVDPGAPADVAIYHVGNDPDAHGWIVDALRKRPGVVVMHEHVLHHLIAGITIGRGDGKGYLAAMERERGVVGRLLGLGVLDNLLPLLWETRPQDYPLCGTILEVAQLLAQAIVRDGEGATKFITITVDEGETREECLRVGKAIANSPLVKTAFFASDPNLGRILAAVGNAGIAELDPSTVGLRLGDVTVVERGGRSGDYTEAQGKAVMKPAEISMTITLGRGIETATVWTCDFSYDYVKINADYRS